MFRVGDLVEAKDNYYNITRKGVICEIVGVNGNHLKVVTKEVIYSIKPFRKQTIKSETVYEVDKRRFNLYKSNKKNNI